MNPAGDWMTSGLSPHALAMTLDQLGALRGWVATLLPSAVTLVGFLIVARQLKAARPPERDAPRTPDVNVYAPEYPRAEAWKRFEFVWKEVKDFLEDERVQRVSHMLDWSLRHYDIECSGRRKYLVAIDAATAEKSEFQKEIHRFKVERHFAVLTASLRLHDSHRGAGNFTQAEQFVRDEFDWFLRRLSIFFHFIEIGAMEYSDVDELLKYTLELLSGLRSKDAGEAVGRYIDRYGFHHVRSLLDLHRQRREAPGVSEPRLTARSVELIPASAEPARLPP